MVSPYMGSSLNTRDFVRQHQCSLAITEIYVVDERKNKNPNTVSGMGKEMAATEGE